MRFKVEVEGFGQTGFELLISELEGFRGSVVNSSNTTILRFPCPEKAISCIHAQGSKRKLVMSEHASEGLSERERERERINAFLKQQTTKPCTSFIKFSLPLYSSYITKPWKTFDRFLNKAINPIKVSIHTKAVDITSRLPGLRELGAVDDGP